MSKNKKIIQEKNDLIDLEKQKNKNIYMKTEIDKQLKNLKTNVTKKIKVKPKK